MARDHQSELTEVSFSRLCRGEISTLLIGDRQPIASDNWVVFPGAFDPLHAGHREIARHSHQLTGQGVVFEISVVNVDKPQLTWPVARQRLAQFHAGDVICLTHAPTFEAKSCLFPGCTFLAGADTIIRVGDVRYYDDTAHRDRAVSRIIANRCRFLVFGRKLGEEFRTLNGLPVPSALTEICRGTSEAEFRVDVTSTQLRAGRDNPDE